MDVPFPHGQDECSGSSMHIWEPRNWLVNNQQRDGLSWDFGGFQFQETVNSLRLEHGEVIMAGASRCDDSLFPGQPLKVWSSRNSDTTSHWKSYPRWFCLEHARDMTHWLVAAFTPRRGYHRLDTQELVFSSCGHLVSGTPDGGFRDQEGLLRLVQAWELLGACCSHELVAVRSSWEVRCMSSRDAYWRCTTSGNVGCYIHVYDIT